MSTKSVWIDGVKITGNEYSVKKFLRTHHHKAPLYKSTTCKEGPISTINQDHLKNAIVKKLTDDPKYTKEILRTIVTMLPNYGNIAIEDFIDSLRLEEVLTREFSRKGKTF